MYRKLSKGFRLGNARSRKNLCWEPFRTVFYQGRLGHVSVSICSSVCTCRMQTVLALAQGMVGLDINTKCTNKNRSTKCAQESGLKC